MFNKKPRKTSGSQSGMTLIEVIISLVLVGGMIVLFAASMNVTLLNRRLKNTDIASHIANAKMEELRNTAYASLPPSATFSDANLSQLPSGSASFTVSDYSTYTGVKELVVTVSWNDGRARSVVLRSLAGSGGINP